MGGFTLWNALGLEAERIWFSHYKKNTSRVS